MNKCASGQLQCMQSKQKCTMNNNYDGVCLSYCITL